MYDAHFLTVLYKKHFNSKDAAERFIERHKRQDCFEISPCSWNYFAGWQVTKTRPATQAEIDGLFSNIKKRDIKQ